MLLCYKEPILTSGGKKTKTKQINATLWSFARLHTGSSLFLIKALNSSVNKTCWQNVTACDIKEVYIKTWFMCGSQGSSIRLLQVLSSTLPCLWAASEASCLQEGRWLLWMQGSECEGEERTLHTLMRPYSLLLVFIIQQCGKCVCECERERNSMRRSACGAYVQWLCVELGMRVCDFCVCVCVWRWGGGRGISTAATSSDSNVTVHLGLCRQCG